MSNGAEGLLPSGSPVGDWPPCCRPWCWVTIVVFSLTFYHLCLHAKRMEVLTQGDGPLWAFEQGQLDILSQEADGATVYGGSGRRVTVRNGEITAVTDENMGFSKFYEGGVLTSVTFDNPLAEAAALCTPSL